MPQLSDNDQVGAAAVKTADSVIAMNNQFKNLNQVAQR